MKDMEKSITLIGLPGCGKTTVGNLLSDKLNYNFIDMDYYIEENQEECYYLKQLVQIPESSLE